MESSQGMTDSEKLDLLIDLVMKYPAKFEAIEKRLHLLETSQQEWRSDMKLFTKRLEILEQRSSQGVAEEAVPKITDEVDNLELQSRMRHVAEVSLKNAQSLQSSVEDLRLKLNDLRKETVILTKSTIAQESFERNEESKNVAVYNISEEHIRPFRNHTNSEEEAVGVFVKQLAQQTVENLRDSDIKSIRKISSNSPKGYHSAVIAFVSVGDAQKFDFRVNQTMKGWMTSSNNRRLRNRIRMSTRGGLSVLQRSLQADADGMIGNYDSRDHPTNRRLRRDNIRKLTDWSHLEKPIKFEPIVTFSVIEEIVIEPVTRNQ